MASVLIISAYPKNSKRRQLPEIMKDPALLKFSAGEGDPEPLNSPESAINDPPEPALDVDPGHIPTPPKPAIHAKPAIYTKPAIHPAYHQEPMNPSVPDRRLLPFMFWRG